MSREKIGDMVVAGKAEIPYKKITDFNSLTSRAEVGFFYERSEFSSELKEKVITNEKFENSNFLFLILKIFQIGTTSIISKMSVYYIK